MRRLINLKKVIQVIILTCSIIIINNLSYAVEEEDNYTQTENTNNSNQESVSNTETTQKDEVTQTQTEQTQTANPSNNQSNYNSVNNTKKENQNTNNTNLSNLGIRPNDFSGFKSWITSYDVKVPKNLKSVEIYATAQDPKAKISGIGTKNLEDRKKYIFNNCYSRKWKYKNIYNKYN